MSFAWRLSRFLSCLLHLQLIFISFTEIVADIRENVASRHNNLDKSARVLRKFANLIRLERG